MIWFLWLSIFLLLGIFGQGWWLFLIGCVVCFIDVAWARPARERERIERDIDNSWR